MKTTFRMVIVLFCSLVAVAQVADASDDQAGRPASAAQGSGDNSSQPTQADLKARFGVYADLLGRRWTFGLTDDDHAWEMLYRYEGGRIYAEKYNLETGWLDVDKTFSIEPGNEPGTLLLNLPAGKQRTGTIAQDGAVLWLGQKSFLHGDTTYRARLRDWNTFVHEPAPIGGDGNPDIDDRHHSHLTFKARDLKAEQVAKYGWSDNPGAPVAGPAGAQHIGVQGLHSESFGYLASLAESSVILETDTYSSFHWCAPAQRIGVVAVSKDGKGAGLGSIAIDRPSGRLTRFSGPCWAPGEVQAYGAVQPDGSIIWSARSGVFHYSLDPGGGLVVRRDGLQTGNVITAAPFRSGPQAVQAMMHSAAEFNRSGAEIWGDLGKAVTGEWLVQGAGQPEKLQLGWAELYAVMVLHGSSSGHMRTYKRGPVVGELVMIDNFHVRNWNGRVQPDGSVIFRHPSFIFKAPPQRFRLNTSRELVLDYGDTSAKGFSKVDDSVVYPVYSEAAFQATEQAFAASERARKKAEWQAYEERMNLVMGVLGVTDAIISERAAETEARLSATLAQAAEQGRQIEAQRAAEAASARAAQLAALDAAADARIEEQRSAADVHSPGEDSAIAAAPQSAGVGDHYLRARGSPPSVAKTSAKSSHHQALAEHLERERRSIRLRSIDCPATDGYVVAGTRPSGPTVANCISVEFEARCPSARPGTGHVDTIHNYVGGDSCLGDTIDIPELSCPAENAIVSVLSVEVCP